MGFSPRKTLALDRGFIDHFPDDVNRGSWTVPAPADTAGEVDPNKNIFPRIVLRDWAVVSPGAGTTYLVGVSGPTEKHEQVDNRRQSHNIMQIILDIQKGYENSSSCCFGRRSPVAGG